MENITTITYFHRNNIKKTDFLKSLAEFLSIAKISKIRGFYGKNPPMPLLP